MACLFGFYCFHIFRDSIDDESPGDFMIGNDDDDDVLVAVAVKTKIN